MNQPIVRVYKSPIRIMFRLQNIEIYPVRLQSCIKCLDTKIVRAAFSYIILEAYPFESGTTSCGDR